MDKKEVKKGTLLLSEQPFVYVLSSKFRTEYCDVCFLKKDLRRCSNCQYVYYCGKTCQRDGWSIHKLECSSFKRIIPRIVPDAARLLFRLIKKLGKGGSNIKSYYTKTKYRKFKDLMSHYPNIKDDPIRMEHFMSLCGVLSELLGNEFMPNTVELMGIYGRMCVNSYSICDDELKTLGTGIYLAASIIDHSCQPNAVAIFQGILLNIRATEEMGSLNWDKVFLSYTDTLQTPEVRQKDLISTYYFLCKCPRCLDPKESLIMSAGACPNQKCDAPLPLSKETLENCYQCGTVISEDVKQQFKEVTELTDMHLQNMKLAYLDVCKVCLRKHEGVLHRLNIQHVRILDSAFESSIDFGQWDDAKKFGIALIPGFRKYLGDIHPLLGLLYLKLAKILAFQGDLVSARKYLRESCTILEITHGDNSNLYKNEILPLIQECMLH
ncbi:hypothetical protein RN001_004468 [Aquatica leii]|uniref:MYND-type domain-containing protein n=1 Tax=Aquatica leii TaxID=1421715 RepID=A0AAN7PYK7_9COLE|nr:hypothetical protein RN001_004468 [Aquatica leii]